jgi:hypothetical protein
LTLATENLPATAINSRKPADWMITPPNNKPPRDRGAAGWSTIFIRKLKFQVTPS